VEIRMSFSGLEDGFPGRQAYAPEPPKNGHALAGVEILDEVIGRRTVVRDALDFAVKFQQLVSGRPLELPFQRFGHPRLQEPAGVQEQPYGLIVLPDGGALGPAGGQTFRVHPQKFRSAGKLLENRPEGLDGIDDDRTLDNVVWNRFSHLRAVYPQTVLRIYMRKSAVYGLTLADGLLIGDSAGGISVAMAERKRYLCSGLPKLSLQLFHRGRHAAAVFLLPYDDIKERSIPIDAAGPQGTAPPEA
jgi:hypothetical protein